MCFTHRVFFRAQFIALAELLGLLILFTNKAECRMKTQVSQFEEEGLNWIMRNDDHFQLLNIKGLFITLNSLQVTYVARLF